VPEKLLTLQELSVYLGISEEKITSLVEDGVVSAYKIGGEFLRFRRSQIDAIHSEIDSRVQESDKISPEHVGGPEKIKRFDRGNRLSGSFSDTVADIFYFYDFYIISTVLIAALLAVIFFS